MRALISISIMGLSLLTSTAAVEAQANQERVIPEHILVRVMPRDLVGVDLSGAALADVSFKRVTMSGANMSGANLTRSRFPDANLDRADFSNADLTEADLSTGTFVGANFRGALLRNTSLTRANLTDADLTGARELGYEINQARLCNTRLSQTVVLNRDCGELGVRAETPHFVDRNAQQRLLQNRVCVGCDLRFAQAANASLIEVSASVPVPDADASDEVDPSS